MRPGHDEAGGGDGLRIVRRQFIAGELPAHKGVEREIVVQAVDDEVTEMPGRGTVVVALLPVAVGEACDVEPVPRPALPVLRAGQ